jgi:hypothetical protein
MGSRFLALAATAAVLAGVAASPALAQDDGLTVDPGSPSGKQYAIPLQAGRANGGTSGDRKSSSKTPKKNDDGALFGVGIRQSTQATAPSPPPSTTTEQRPASKKPKTPHQSKPKRTAPAPTTAQEPAASAAPVGGGGDGGGGGGGTVALIVAGVLAAGLAGGGLLRRQARSATQ